ncbi:hypothetical protein T03_12492 [Trichinella britovi]|uniref:Uncharacterized protein n=1 Tax=Trichinella britovi TaxID=45882 RepID=A0A0V1CWU4_TRIBR|nr:hypothetical protein T03_12492 [Trichinella britovi]
MSIPIKITVHSELIEFYIYIEREATGLRKRQHLHCITLLPTVASILSRHLPRSVRCQEALVGHLIIPVVYIPSMNKQYSNQILNYLEHFPFASINMEPQHKMVNSTFTSSDMKQRDCGKLAAASALYHFAPNCSVDIKSSCKANISCPNS